MWCLSVCGDWLFSEVKTESGVSHYAGWPCLVRFTYYIHLLDACIYVSNEYSLQAEVSPFINRDNSSEVEEVRLCFVCTVWHFAYVCCLERIHSRILIVCLSRIPFTCCGVTPPPFLLTMPAMLFITEMEREVMEEYERVWSGCIHIEHAHKCCVKLHTPNVSLRKAESQLELSTRMCHLPFKRPKAISMICRLLVVVESDLVEMSCCGMVSQLL